MTDHNYESGRLNLPFVGISTFAKKTYQGDPIAFPPASLFTPQSGVSLPRWRSRRKSECRPRTEAGHSMLPRTPHSRSLAWPTTRG
jgi:hypothetical protein